MYFATAHSRGLRRAEILVKVKHVDLCHSAFARVATFDAQCITSREIFATAHSRGLRLEAGVNLVKGLWLCHSAFARVATIQVGYKG